MFIFFFSMSRTFLCRLIRGKWGIRKISIFIDFFMKKKAIYFRVCRIIVRLIFVSSSSSFFHLMNSNIFTMRNTDWLLIRKKNETCSWNVYWITNVISARVRFAFAYDHIVEMAKEKQKTKLNTLPTINNSNIETILFKIVELKRKMKKNTIRNAD